MAAEPAERAARQQHLQQAEADFGDPLPFDAAAARAFGPIAAVAISADLPVYTFDATDFAATGAEIVDLGEID